MQYRPMLRTGWLAPAADAPVERDADARSHQSQERRANQSNECNTASGWLGWRLRDQRRSYQGEPISGANLDRRPDVRIPEQQTGLFVQLSGRYQVAVERIVGTLDFGRRLQAALEFRFLLAQLCPLPFESAYLCSTSFSCVCSCITAGVRVA